MPLIALVQETCEQMSVIMSSLRDVVLITRASSLRLVPRRGTRKDPMGDSIRLFALVRLVAFV